MSGGKALIEALRNPAAYAHAVNDLQVLETHISWVILTGKFAYKIKKPICLEFLDFSSLDLRRKWCNEELRLNRRWSPSLYLAVVPITGSVASPVMDGEGSAIEFAVKMQQFPQNALLSAELDDGRLAADDVLRLAEMIADRHIAAPVNQSERFGGPSAVLKPMVENLHYLREALGAEILERLERWTHQQYSIRRATISARAVDGFVRECHGDLHLRNLVRLPSGVAAFDCIEFSDELRMLDVISDLSFLTMDLTAGARPDLADILLNRYLELTGDYAGMTLYRLYFVYHCLIRAKVHAIRAAELGSDSGRTEQHELVQHYADIALGSIDHEPAALVVMHGLSGSGKTRVSAALMSSLSAIRLRSDIERKRIFGLSEGADSASAPGEGIYASAASVQTYERLHALAKDLLEAGHRVVLDAAYLKVEERQAAASLARQCGAQFVMIAVEAPYRCLQERLRLRQAEGRDASEAGIDVLDRQMRTVDVPGESEFGSLIRFENGADADLTGLCRDVAERFAAPLA